MKKEDAVLLVEEVISDYSEENSYDPDQHYEDVMEALHQARDALEI